MKNLVNTCGHDLRLCVSTLKTALSDRERVIEEMNYVNNHELRGPLATIKGLISVLESFSEPQERSALLQLLRKKTDELDDVIHKINRRAVREY